MEQTAVGSATQRSAVDEVRQAAIRPAARGPAMEQQAWQARPTALLSTARRSTLDAVEVRQARQTAVRLAARRPALARQARRRLAGPPGEPRRVAGQAAPRRQTVSTPGRPSAEET